MNIPGLLLHVIHQQVLSKRVRSSEVSLPAAKLSNLLHKMHQAIITSQHKSIDQNSSPPALSNFFQSLCNDKRIQPKRILINPPILKRKRRRLPVSNHHNL